VPGVAIVPLHRLRRAGAIGVEQRFGLGFEQRECRRPGVAVGRDDPLDSVLQR
jgi:hypothetical protein